MISKIMWELYKRAAIIRKRREYYLLDIGEKNFQYQVLNNSSSYTQKF